MALREIAGTNHDEEEWDSAWQTTLKRIEYLFDDATGEVVVRELEIYTNIRRPENGYRKVLEEKRIPRSEVPLEVAEKLVALGI